MNRVEFKNWSDFRATVNRYCRLQRARRDDFWFRGHGSESHQLQTTLDRTYSFEDDIQRFEYTEQLTEEFRREAILLGANDKVVKDRDQLQLLARHHGLPSPLLDWTQSPFVATYFALVDPEPANSIAIWALDLSKADATSGEFDLINDKDKLLGNKRALRQRGTFLHVTSIQRPLETVLDAALTQFVVPVDRDAQQHALNELDEMMINGTSLFEDFNGAAQTAANRMAR